MVLISKTALPSFISNADFEYYLLLFWLKSVAENSTIEKGFSDQIRTFKFSKRQGILKKLVKHQSLTPVK